MPTAQTAKNITIQVTKEVVGYCYLGDYQNIFNDTLYLVPTYRMNVYVEGQEEPVGQYEVVRFGISSYSKVTHKQVDPYVSGLADQQWSQIGVWDPKRPCESDPRAEKGAWTVDVEYMVHAGSLDPRNPKADIILGASGCIEVVGYTEYMTAWQNFKAHPTSAYVLRCMA